MNVIADELQEISKEIMNILNKGLLKSPELNVRTTAVTQLKELYIGYCGIYEILAQDPFLSEEEKIKIQRFNRLNNKILDYLEKFSDSDYFKVD